MNKKSLTLVEIIVGSFILVLVYAGMLAAFFGVREYMNRANKRLISLNLARQVLNELYEEVREDWNVAGGDLTLGAHNNVINESIDGWQYTGDYDVYNVAGSNCRQVDISVTYPTDPH
ncbi:MAG: hypothetical protein GF375_06965 [Candidatus Omnitrophica bacterium]|nr:hypothetical protein [Candidatus Omnitrophota bacterium]MBD3269717.1 hypothetical protein [Candidatus Omnitrophota bacterium]